MLETLATIWLGLKLAGMIIGGLIILVLAILYVYVVVLENKEKR